MNQELIKQIDQIKKQRNAIILAHYYVDDAVQAIADYVGDSYYLSKVAKETSAEVILFAGVNFMGESAKILNPDKIVLLPDHIAYCPMANMVEPEDIEEIREKYEDVAVVCYINSSTEIKALSDVCVTSSNALKVVNQLPHQFIYFIPDNNLGRYVASQIPQKEFIFHDGFCHVHTSITKENVLKAKEVLPEAEILVHPECTMDVVGLGDYVGSTSGIIDYAKQSHKEAFIICTEMGILYELQNQCPNKKFYSVGHRQFCPNMKRITLEKVYTSLANLSNEVHLDEEVRVKAAEALQKMLELAE